jgi:hypothetical protein
MLAQTSNTVMAGLVPAIHVFDPAKTWMPGTGPGMMDISSDDVSGAI